MDGITEPVIAVIDHPIAGNPTQFALGRAFAAMNIEFRALSFDVSADKIGAALDGLDALKFRGVVIGPSLAAVTAQWCQMRAPENVTVPAQVDCLYRVASDDRFVASHCQRSFLQDAIQKHFATRGRTIDRTLVLGQDDCVALTSDLEIGEINRPRSTPDATEIGEADLILIGDDQFEIVDDEASGWNTNDASKLVIDLSTHGHPALDGITSNGYATVSTLQQHAGTLLHCIRHWTDQECQSDVIHDAIEEYLAI